MKSNKEYTGSKRALAVIGVTLGVLLIGAIGVNKVESQSVTPVEGVTKEVYVTLPQLNSFNVNLQQKTTNTYKSQSSLSLDAQWLKADQLTNKKILERQLKVRRYELLKQVKAAKASKQSKLVTLVGDQERAQPERLPGQTELEYNEANAPIMFPKNLSDRMEHLLRLVEQGKGKSVYKDTYSVSNTFEVRASAYVADCYGCSGITSTGIDVRKDTPNIIAVDPSVIPLGTQVDMWVEGVYFGVYTASDVGGAIKGNRVDMLIETRESALRFGMRDAILRIRTQTK